MPAETTAIMAIGSRREFFNAPVFAPTKILTLREGFRSNWILNEPLDRRPCRRVDVLPPTHNDVWSGGLLMALWVRARNVLESSDFNRTIFRDRRGHLTFETLIEGQEAELLAMAGKHLDISITVFRGCGIRGDQLEKTAEYGWMVARAERPQVKPVQLESLEARR